ncbi:MAG TPA: hypothetical protein VM265_08145 [Sphingomicrobium sp.]|nr:hypothetical protein [Sphingomicrobium sp.]
MEYLTALPWQAWAALLPLAGAALWKPACALARWMAGRQSRIEHLEQAIDELRRALDKGRVRESAIASVAELLIFAIDHVDAPSPAIVALRARALEVLELAQAQLGQFNRREGL